MTSPTPADTPGQEARRLLKSLQETHAVFKEIQPLAIGLDKQLLALDANINRKALRLALGMHTNSFRYLKSMEKATQRFNLDGSPAGEVPEGHRKHASEILRERSKKEAERRQAEAATRKAEAATRKAEAEEKAAQEAEKLRTEKLNRLVQKFAR